MKSRSLGGFFAFSMVASALGLAAACDSSSDGNVVTGPATPEAGTPVVPDSGAACPAADYLAGKPIPSGGTIHGTEPSSPTWKAADSPHIVSSHLEFGAGTSLTIEPCALVVMGEGSAISVGATPDANAIGDLIAAGDATHPIVLTGATAAKNAWQGLGLDQTGPATVLSYVTIERAQIGDATGASVRVSGKSSPRIDHTTIRDGKGYGIHITGGAATFGAGSGANVISGMGIRPVLVHPAALTSLPEGTYTGNANDRIEVRHEGGPIKADVTWHKRSVPYLLDDQVPATFHGKLTIEPSVHISVGARAAMAGQDPSFTFINGGSLVADGGAEATRILIESDTTAAWAGFAFLRADAAVGLAASGPGVFNFITIKNAGGGNGLAGGNACYDNNTGPAPHTVIRADQDVIDVKNTEFFDIGANNFAITRDFCGTGGAYMTEASRKNVFHGTMHCPVTDQHECASAGPCTISNSTCCQHAYACNGTTVP
jgi:hypothetical protein